MTSFFPFAPDEIILPLLAYTFLTPLNEFLHRANCEPKFVLCMLGKTGTCKSTLSALFLSFFGRFTGSDLPLSFRDTANSIMYNAFSLKDNCSVHRIRETELDEIIYGEITNVRKQAEQLYENIDSEVRKWLKKKSTVTGKINQLNGELEQRKADQKDILLERIRDKEHAEVYDEMLVVCENDIKRIEQELYDIQHYSETIKKRKSEMKHTVDLIDEIISEGQISDVNLRQLIDKILIYETVEGLRIQVNLKADFTEHMIIFNDLGKKMRRSQGGRKEQLSARYAQEDEV